MVFTMLKGEKEKASLDSREAYNLWATLKSDYLALYRLKIYLNDTHDADLTLIIKSFINFLEKNIDFLERLMKKYSLPSPDRNRVAVNFPINSQAVADELLAGDIFLFLQESIEEG